MTDDTPALPQPNPILVTDGSIGRYVYINEIVRSSVAVTSLFRDPLIERQVAIKIPHPYLSEDERQLFEKQWIQEAGKLNHPNIVTVYDADKSNDVLYVVMEYLEGNALSDLLNSDHQFTYKQIAELIARVATALDYAHEQGVIHRGIKPASIFITENLVPKLIDFGMSHASDQLSQAGTSGNQSKHPGSDLNNEISDNSSDININTGNTNNSVNNAINVSGDLSDNTVEQLINDVVSVEARSSVQQFAAINYHSPEQIKGKTLDARTDIFSLGVVLYQLLCGELPFKGEDDKQLRKAIARSSAIPPQEIHSDVPLRLARIAARALAKKPADRYARASELAGDLNRYLYKEKAKRVIAELHNTTLGTTFTVVNNADQEKQKNNKKTNTVQLLVVTAVVLVAGITSLVLIVPVPSRSVALEKNDGNNSRLAPQAAPSRPVALIESVNRDTEEIINMPSMTQKIKFLPDNKKSDSAANRVPPKIKILSKTASAAAVPSPIPATVPDVVPTVLPPTEKR